MTSKIFVKCDNSNCPTPDLLVEIYPHQLKHKHHFHNQKCQNEWFADGNNPTKRKDVRDAISKANSKSLLGNTNSVGNVLSDSTRESMSIAQTNHEVSESTRQKLSKAHSNNKHTRFGLMNEKLLSIAFPEWVRMPPKNPGFDFYCTKMHKIDAKGAFLKNHSCLFSIKRNVTADYFACVIYADQEDHDDFSCLTPLHLFLIPGDVVNDRVSIFINITQNGLTKSKYAQYEKPIDKVLDCCNVLKEQLGFTDNKDKKL